MKALLAGAAIAALTVGSAQAANTALIMWNDANPGGFESALGTGSANLVGQNFDGITVTLSAVNRTTGPNQLTTAQLNIDNTTNTVQTLKIIAGANGFLGNDSVFKLTGAIGATFGTSDLFGQFFADGGNTLNGTNFGVVGVVAQQLRQLVADRAAVVFVQRLRQRLRQQPLRAG